MKQFKTIFAFEFRNYLKNKIFVGVTLLLVAVIAIVMYMPNIINVFKGDSESPSGDALPVMLISTEDESLATLALSSFKNAFSSYEVKITSEGEDGIKDSIANGEAECAFILENASSYKYYVQNLSLYDTNPQTATELLTTVYRMIAMVNSGLTEESAATIMGVTVTGESISLDKDQSNTFLYTYVMSMALYMVTMLYGQMVATGVASEKSSRAMELLITSANPLSMMFGKVFAACFAGLSQLTVIFGSALILYKLNSDAWGGNMIMESIFNIPPELFAYMLVFFLLGFLIYAFLYGAIGSTVSKLEDVNTALLPLTYLSVIAFMIVMMSMSSGSIDNIAMMICSYVPFTSPMAMFTRIAMSTVPAYEIIISISILTLSVIGIAILSAKIYRVGVLMYGNKPNVFTIIKNIYKKQS